MKVEYSYFGENPSLVIKGADFIKAYNDTDECYLLNVAINSFAANFNAQPHFQDDVNEVIMNRVEKNGEIIYTIKNRRIGGRISEEWCEVYIRNGSRHIEIVISNDNGRTYLLNRTK